MFNWIKDKIFMFFFLFGGERITMQLAENCKLVFEHCLEKLLFHQLPPTARFLRKVAEPYLQLHHKKKLQHPRKIELMDIPNVPRPKVPLHKTRFFRLSVDFAEWIKIAESMSIVDKEAPRDKEGPIYWSTRFGRYEFANLLNPRLHLAGKTPHPL